MSRFCQNIFSTRQNYSVTCGYCDEEAPPPRRHTTSWQGQGGTQVANFSGASIVLLIEGEKSNINNYQVGRFYKTFGGYIVQVIGKDTRKIELMPNMGQEAVEILHKTFIDLMTLETDFEHMILYRVDYNLGAA